MGDLVVLVVAAATPIVAAAAVVVLARRAPASAPARAGRLAAINLLVLTALVSVTFLVFEGYHRFIRDTTDAFSVTRGSERWFERHYRYNRLGVRDDVEYSFARRAGVRRITFLGDSFTAGHGVADPEKRFANLVRARHPSGWEVHVLAANGIDTGGEIERLRRMVADGYELDVVVLVYVLNDISDLDPRWQAVLERVYARQGSEPFLVRHSLFLNDLYYRILGRLDPDLRSYYRFVLEDYRSPLWERQEARLDGLVRFCRQRGALFVAVTFPFLQSLGPGYEYREVHAALDRFWASEGVPHVDLLPVFESHASRELVVSRRDPHPNAFAHRLAAEAIIPLLERLCPPGPPGGGPPGKATRTTGG
jgi:hypothetical protein